MSRRFIFSALVIALLSASVCAAQSGGIVPPGNYPKGPFAGFATPVPRKGEIVVKFRSAAFRQAIANARKRYTTPTPGKHAVARELARLLGLRTSSQISGNSFIVKGVSGSSSRTRVAQRRGLVARVEQNYKMTAFAQPNDFLYSLGFLWGIANNGSSGGTSNVDVDALEAWQTTRGSPDLVVAVLDTGVSLTHPDLIDNIWRNPGEIAGNGLDDDKNGFVDDTRGYDFVDDDANPEDLMFHGTHCAGIIAASEGNGRGVCGVAPAVKILPLRVLNARGEGDAAGVMRAIRYAIDLRKRGVNLRVLNASLGGGDRLASFEDLLKEANRYGIVFVAAAGNESNDNDAKPTYPAGYEVPNVISVAAVDRAGNLASFSNYGPRSVDVAAPGVGIWSTFILGFYLPFDGTSMAAPFVSGTAALVLSQQPGLSAAQVVGVLRGSTKRLSTLEGLVGSPGIVSAQKALQGL